MRDLLSRLLPRRAREEWFEPSCCDARIANQPWLAARIFLIFLQCWGLELRERALNFLPSQRSFVKPTESPKERIPSSGTIFDMHFGCCCASRALRWQRC